MANDEVKNTLLLQVAPSGIKVNVVDVEKAVKVYKNPKYNDLKVFFLFTNSSEVLKLVENGVDIGSVNIDEMAYREGKNK